VHNVEMNTGLPAATPAPSFDDPLGMLFACHRRIEKQLDTLSRLQQHLPKHGSDKDAGIAARAILKYFDEAAPNHHADEEESLFPRLHAALPGPADAVIAPLLDDHALLANNWAALRPLLADIAAGRPVILPAAQVEAVRAAYASHIAREDTDLFPLARRVLDTEALAAMGREMADRRGVSIEAKEGR
jgi:hemerythrin-like domain-containing protein